MDLFSFLGRLHPLVVHLPIGFLIIAAAFDLLRYNVRYRYLQNAVGPALLAGFVSAIFACVFGYLLSLSGSYDEDILGNHKTAGIILAIASGVWWTLASGLLPGKVASDHRFTTAFGVIVVAVLAYTGHQGGSLTHGSDYLSFVDTNKPKRPKPLTVADAHVFDDVVLPILERRCEGCHRRGKRKGDLIVSSYADLMKGGENGKVITPGSLKDSELYRRITLDPEHKDFMPTDGKKPLTKEETEVIRWWIEVAQASTDAKVGAIKGHEEMIPVFASMLGLGGDVGLKDGAIINTRQPNPDIPASTDMAAVDNLRKKGMVVRVMLHSPVMLDVTLPPRSGFGMNELDPELRTVSRNIIWLNVSNNNLKASDLIVLKEMDNLEKLRLERNPVDDAVVDILEDLKHLEALNINDTKVTDAGFSKLKAQPSLKRIYRWSSASGERD